MERIISNCPLCDTRTLHVSDDDASNFMQCIGCGYVSSDMFLGTKEDNAEYKKLDELLQAWVKETDGRLWIPIQMELPFGMLYPALVDNKMKWVFAQNIPIAEEEQKNHPIPGHEGKYYSSKYETDNPKMFDKYHEALREIQNHVQMETQKAMEKPPTKLDIPTLKKVK